MAPPGEDRDGEEEEKEGKREIEKKSGELV